MKHQTTRSTIFDLHGVPAFNQAFPLALQHVVAMIVGCVTPAIIVSGVAGLSEADSVVLSRRLWSLPPFRHCFNYFRLSRPDILPSAPAFRSSWESVLPMCRACSPLLLSMM